MGEPDRIDRAGRATKTLAVRLYQTVLVLWCLCAGALVFYEFSLVIAFFDTPLGQAPQLPRGATSDDWAVLLCGIAMLVAAFVLTAWLSWLFGASPAGGEKRGPPQAVGEVCGSCHKGQMLRWHVGLRCSACRMRTEIAGSSASSPPPGARLCAKCSYGPLYAYSSDDVCPRCGAKVATPAAAATESPSTTTQAPSAPGPAKAGDAFCRGCGAEVSETNDRFCGRCGRATRTEKQA